MTSIARLDQFRLLRLLFDPNGPRFGVNQEKQPFFIGSPECMHDWFRGRLSSRDAAILEATWNERLEQSAVLSSPRQFVAIFVLPALDNGKVHVATFQVRRTLDNRVLCLHVPSERNHTGDSNAVIYDMLQRRLVLQVVAPMIRARRAAAERADVHKDNLIDVNMRLADVDTTADRSGFLTHDNVTTPAAALISMARNVMMQCPWPTGTDASSIIYALLDYYVTLRERSPIERMAPAPRENLCNEIVYGAIAHYVVSNGKLRTRLFLDQELKRSVETVKQLMTEDVCSELVLCPLNGGTGHWTLLYRMPGTGTIPCLFDSLAPRTIAGCSHSQLARQFCGSHMTLIEVPATQKQLGATCGLYVIAVACFLAHDPLPVPVYDLGNMVEIIHSTMASIWSYADVKQLDEMNLETVKTLVDTLQ